MIDYHYHLTGRNLAADILKLKQNIQLYDLKEVLTLAAYFPMQESGISNYRLFHNIKDLDNVFMLASLDFERYFYMYYNEIVDLLQEDNVLGVKIYSGYQNIDFWSEEFFKIMDLCDSKIVMFHTGYCHGGDLEPFDPTILFHVIKKYPNIKFVLAHAGNPFSKEVVELMNFFDNVYTDISGLVEKESDWERALQCIEDLKIVNDQSKILFGTDYPVQSYEDSLRLAYKLGADIPKNTIGD